MKNGKLLMKTLIQQKVSSVQCQPQDVFVKTEGQNSGTFKCGQCLETFCTLVAKKRHEKFFHFFSKPFICDCGQQFGKLCEVNYHIRRVHNKEKNYVCEVCKKAFFKNSDLVIHQSVHEPSAKFICEDCGRRFKHVSNLIRHTRTHTGIKPYLCLPCNKRFSQIAALRQHEITEKHKEKVALGNPKNEESSTLNNDETKNALNSKLENYKSSKTDSNKRKWWFYCKICGERFPFSVLLRDHETKHMTNKDVRCNSCKAEFSCIKEFINHSCSTHLKYIKKKLQNIEVMVNKNQENQKKLAPGETYLLDENEDTLIDKRVELTLAQNGQIMLDNDEVLLTLNDRVYGLVLINNDVTVVDNEDYLQLLNKSQDLFDEAPDFTEMESVFNIENFQSEMNQSEVDGVDRLVFSENWLWAHEDYPGDKMDEGILVQEVKQEDKETLNCTMPDENLDKKENLLENISVDIRKTQKYRCSDCGKEFSWNSSLRNHLIKKHAKKTEFSCVKCNKIYYSKLLVEHHIKRDHLNIRSYKCTFCGKSFFRRYDLKVHIRIHTDERPYICKVCGKRFRHLSHIIRHDKTHLKDSLSKEKDVHPIVKQEPCP